MNIPIQDLLDNFDKLRHEIVQRLSTQKDTPEPEPDSPFTGSPLPSDDAMLVANSLANLIRAVLTLEDQAVIEITRKGWQDYHNAIRNYALAIDHYSRKDPE